MCLNIDKLFFREIPADKYVQRLNIPASWNGNKLNGKKQTNYYILDLAAGNHEINLIMNGKIKDLKWQVSEIASSVMMKFDLHIRADNVNQQPFVNFILVDLPIARITGKATLSWRREKLFVRGDSDDIKLVVDNQVYTDNVDHNSVLNEWLWHAKKNWWQSTKKIKKSACPTLTCGTHYVEFIADRSPRLDQVIIETKPKLKGDYWLNPCYKLVGTKYKAFLGVYLPTDEERAALSNSTVGLTYKHVNLPVGINEHSFNLPNIFSWILNKILSLFETRFDFDKAILQEGRWFYFGIDTSWRMFQELTGDDGIFDFANWRLERKT